MMELNSLQFVKLNKANYIVVYRIVILPKITVNLFGIGVSAIGLVIKSMQQYKDSLRLLYDLTLNKF